MNTRDDYDKVELYLTATGSSIESGDEGLVGRGNRVNQVISINHPMSMEGAAGKNPVYHVGKLYYLAAHKVAQAMYQKFGVYNEVYLVSQSGRSLTSPWKTVVKIDKNKRLAIQEVKKFIADQLQAIPSITEEVIHDKVSIS